MLSRILTVLHAQQECPHCYGDGCDVCNNKGWFEDGD